MRSPQPIALPGIHEKFLSYFLKHAGTRKRILDAGAGHGAMCRRLSQDGFQVTALDFRKTLYQCHEVPFVEADLTQNWPFSDSSFEAVIAVEVWEHLACHQRFLEEAFRILEPRGLLMISTPNILSLKSRFRFLFQGFFYGFKALEDAPNDGLQHLSSQTFDQITWLAKHAGFSFLDFDIDKKQNTSRCLMVFYPLLWLVNKIWKQNPLHNRRKLLTGRILFFTFQKLS